MDFRHPALNYHEANECLREAAGATIVGPPIEIFASYDEGPDLRLTAAFRTDSDELPVVVLKASRFRFLRDSVRVHMLVSEAAPGITPRVIGASESDVGSILFLEPFIGDQIVTFGRDGLEKVARSLAQIQTRLKFEADHSSSVKSTETYNVQAAFAFCKDQILSNFENVWESDRERKLSIAFCGTIADIKSLLNSVERNLSKWIEQVQQSKLPLFPLARYVRALLGPRPTMWLTTESQGLWEPSRVARKDNNVHVVR